nr:DUF4880 domain-containing protein [Pseudomonas sp. BIGb0427]
MTPSPLTRVLLAKPHSGSPKPWKAHSAPEQQRALEQWRAAHPDNERAWLHIEALRRRMAGLEPHAGYQSLSRGSQGRSRRQALKALAVLGLFGCAGQLAYRNVWQPGPN